MSDWPVGVSLGILLIITWLRSVQLTVGDTTSWAGASGLYKKAISVWICEVTREGASNRGYSMAFASGSCLSSCPDFPQGWSVPCKCRFNKYFPPELLLVRVLCQSNVRGQWSHHPLNTHPSLTMSLTTSVWTVYHFSDNCFFFSLMSFSSSSTPNRYEMPHFTFLL